jgi:hypothetical protein
VNAVREANEHARVQGQERFAFTFVELASAFHDAVERRFWIHHEAVAERLVGYQLAQHSFHVVLTHFDFPRSLTQTVAL